MPFLHGQCPSCRRPPGQPARLRRGSIGECRQLVLPVLLGLVWPPLLESADNPHISAGAPAPDGPWRRTWLQPVGDGPSHEITLRPVKRFEDS